MNWKWKKFTIDTGSPVSIMPFDETMMRQKDIQKIRKKNKKRKQKRSEIQRSITGNNRTRKQRIKDSDIDHRMNGYNSVIGNGLDE